MGNLRPAMTTSASEVVVRRLDPLDDLLVDRVARLVVGVYGGEGHVSGPYLDVLGRARERATVADVLVALDVTGSRSIDTDIDRAGAVLGTVTFAVAPHPYANIADPGDGEFRMLAVAPTARRRGIGRALVHACADRARAAGAHRLWLSSGPSMTAAHAMYASMGFTRTPDRDWEPEPGERLLTFATDLHTGPRSGDETQLP